MTDGPNKIKLTQYLTGAQEESLASVGADWKLKGELLDILARALERKGPALAEEIGRESKTAEKLKSLLLDSATNMRKQGEKLTAGGAALNQVSTVVDSARKAREGMAPLERPTPYQPKRYPPGVQPTADQLERDAGERHAAGVEMNSYNSALSSQETLAAEQVAKLDAAFLGAIPPMMAIHGGPDPTEPTPGAPGSGPGALAPMTQPGSIATAGLIRAHGVAPQGPGKVDGGPEISIPEGMPRPPEPTRVPVTPTPVEQITTRPPVPMDPFTPTPTGHLPSTSVPGVVDGGVGYQSPGGSATSVPSGGGGAAVGGAVGAVGAGAAGAALGGGLLKGTAVTGPSSTLRSGGVRGIGATSRAGSAGAISRSAAATGKPAAGSTARGAAGGRGAAAGGTRAAAGARSAGGSASRSAAAAGARSTGGSASRSTGGARSAGGSGQAAGAKGSAAAQGKPAQGKGKGLFRRGSNGSTAGGRGGTRRKDEGAQQRDSLVYEQDWLDDEAAGPGVLS